MSPPGHIPRPVSWSSVCSSATLAVPGRCAGPLRATHWTSQTFGSVVRAHPQSSMLLRAGLSCCPHICPLWTVCVLLGDRPLNSGSQQHLVLVICWGNPLPGQLRGSQQSLHGRVCTGSCLSQMLFYEATGFYKHPEWYFVPSHSPRAGCGAGKLWESGGCLFT